SMYNAVSTDSMKGCPFFNKEEKTCLIHKKRPYNCRIYGITPEKEFLSRLNKLRERDYTSEIGTTVFRDQCNLVSTCSGEEVTQEDIDKWWEELFNIEHELGIRECDINDNVESGSYRTPHDHFLLFILPNNILTSISGIKLYEDEEVKKVVVDGLIKQIKGFYK
ncbi:MAG: YkgJ family cysteine cluster protein, partial [Clostridiales bacterium]|nr:YkgJ family cysteine cluster protein [Clostridiales bacterium]